MASEPKPNAGHANIRPWTKADGSNPAPRSPGRPPKTPLTDSHRKWLATKAPMEVIAAYAKMGARPGDTYYDITSLATIKSALRGNTHAAKELRESTEGKSPMRVLLDDHNSAPIQLTVVYEDEIPSRAEQDAAIDMLEAEPTEQRKALPAANAESERLKNRA